MRLSLFAATALLLTSLAARADTVFNLSGTLSNGGVLSGTFTVNTVAGTVDSLNAVYTLGAQSTQFSSILDQRPADVDYLVISNNGDYRFDLFLPPSSLIGYSGGLCTANTPCGTYNETSYVAMFSTVFFLTNGSATAVPPTAAATPEPSSLVLLGTGILGVLGVMKRRLA